MRQALPRRAVTDANRPHSRPQSLQLTRYLATSTLEKDASFIEQPCGEAILLPQQAQQQVVNSDVLMGRMLSFFGGIGQYTLAFLAQRQVYGSRNPLPNRCMSFNLLADGFFVSYK